MRLFNEAIQELDHIYISLNDRKFKWFKPSGKARCRINKVLVTEVVGNMERGVQEVLDINLSY